MPRRPQPARALRLGRRRHRARRRRDRGRAGAACQPQPAARRATPRSCATICARPDIRHLLIEEATEPGDRDRQRPRHRASGSCCACSTAMPRPTTDFDPVANHYFVRVRWRDADRLTQRYCFISRCSGQPPTLGRERLLRQPGDRPPRKAAPHGARPPRRGPAGRPTRTASSATTRPTGKQRTGARRCRCRKAPLAFRETAPGGEMPPISRRAVVAVSGFAECLGGADRPDRKRGRRSALPRRDRRAGRQRASASATASTAAARQRRHGRPATTRSAAARPATSARTR